MFVRREAKDSELMKNGRFSDDKLQLINKPLEKPITENPFEARDKLFTPQHARCLCVRASETSSNCYAGLCAAFFHFFLK